MVIVTDNAASKIKHLLEADNKSSMEFGLRVGVTGGGCSGMQYMMDWDTERSGDKVFANGEVKVFIDPKSLSFVDGSTLDYVESLQGAGFQMKNPQQTGSCGCGSSFSV
jgi:iron-sulfur cluster assembly accessory protein